MRPVQFLAVLAVACSELDVGQAPADGDRKPGAPPITEASGAELQKNVHLTGVGGVTDTSINVAVSPPKTNCLVGCYSAYVGRDRCLASTT